MSNFNLDDYVPVNTRIEQFWEKHPNGCIDTEIIKWENGVVLMKASVYKELSDDAPAATGHAYEKEGGSYINKTSAIENCETSAVGRALAIMGFEIKHSIASREEVENAIKNQTEISTKEDNELKKELLKKHKGDKAKAKAEYESMKAKEDDLDADMAKYVTQSLEV